MEGVLILQTKDRTVDLVVVTLANLMNIIMVFIFYARTKGAQHPLVFGFTWGVFILVLAVVVFLNIMAKRAWWFIVLPLLLAMFLMLELVLDYVLQIEFRSTKLLGPYLLLYYASIMGMIGYAFLTEKKYGVITLVTYFASQIAAFFSYIQVGHG
jgi:hypothetical protein